MIMGSSDMMRRQMEIQGPRPTPLVVSKNSKKVMKKKPMNSSSVNPVIVYLISPKIIHVQPEEFMDLVQRLTGRNNCSTTQGSSSSTSDCLMSQGDFSGSYQRIDRGDQYYADHVPFGAPTSTSFAEIF